MSIFAHFLRNGCYLTDEEIVVVCIAKDYIKKRKEIKWEVLKPSERVLLLNLIALLFKYENDREMLES